MSLLPTVRQRKLVSLLDAHGAVSTADAAKYLGVSSSTVRRDISQLHKRGRALRVRGGVVSNSLR
jgi:DeoR/GlpR family transcriptional regulator of sugar metabolism